MKSFYTGKGYGFIKPGDGERDVFVHVSAVERPGLAGLKDGQKVECDLVEGRNGRQDADSLNAV